MSPKVTSSIARRTSGAGASTRLTWLLWNGAPGSRSSAAGSSGFAAIASPHVTDVELIIAEPADVIGQDIPAAVAARLRRQEALYDPTKRFEFVLTEAGLRWPAGDHSVMAAQYDRIMQVSTLSNVEIDIIPLGRPVSALPWCDVNLYDDLADDEPPIIDVELPHAEVWVTDPIDVTVYVELVRRLWDSSLTGDAARALLAGLSRQTGRQ
jgi:hypothetical protein